MSVLDRMNKPSANSGLYYLALAVFALLLTLRESASFGHLFDFIPILGGNIPFFTLALLLAAVFMKNGGRLTEVGLGWPSWKSSRQKMVLGILLAAALIFVARQLVSSALGPTLDGLGPRADTLERMAPLVGNLPLLLMLLPLMWLAVIGEELLFRGFIMNFVAKRLGGRVGAWAIAVIVSALLFGVAHFWQGPRGMVATGVGALVMGTAYYLVGRNLWPTILSHSLGNTLGFISIYLGD